MARRAHSRSESYVEGFSRNGSWVSGHYRSGTSVSASNKLSEKQIAENIRRIDEYYTPLVYKTNCFWCEEKVFFYRSEDGGCALFDRLGKPWDLHRCWEIHKQEIKRAVANELYRGNFNGRVYYKERQRASKPIKSDSISMVGFVDRQPMEKVRLPSCRGSTTGMFRTINFVPEDKIDVYYSVLVPSTIAEAFPNYSMHQVDCIFSKYKNRWYCLLTKYRRMSASGKSDQVANAGVVLDGNCSVCGILLTDKHWGFGSDFGSECSSCGRMRGTRTSDEFAEFIRGCYKQQRKRKSK